MKLKKSAAVAFLFLIFVFAANQAATALDVPPLTSPVMDNAKIMSDSARAELEEYLLTLDKNSSAQIAVLTIPSLKGADLEGYAIQVCRKWGLGQKEDSKGVLLLISLEEKKIRIETGYGAEGDLTDAKCGLIIRNVIAPDFQNEKYAEGIINGVKAIAKAVAPNAEDGKDIEEKEKKPDVGAIIAMVIFFTLYFIMFTGMLSTKFKALKWLPWAPFFISNAKRPHSTHYSTYNSFGSGGFGTSGFGSSGGGFRGGGGGFGGGGASGGW